MKHALCMVAGTLLIAFAPSLTAAQLSLGKESLKGLKGIYVGVEDLDQDVEQRGLTKSQLVTDIELRLRKAGIPVPAESRSYGEDIGSLIVTVSTRASGNMYVFFIEADLSQMVCLVRTPSKHVPAMTYKASGTIGTVGANNLRDVRTSVGDMIDTLINDYLAMNPKP